MNLSLDANDLRPLVQAIVAETLAAIRESDALLDGSRLAYPEAEAAAVCGVRPHVLRDARLRGEITATKLGGRIGYERTELVAYLARQRRAAT
jgi:hypothetical protein